MKLEGDSLDSATRRDHALLFNHPFKSPARGTMPFTVPRIFSKSMTATPFYVRPIKFKGKRSDRATDDFVVVSFVPLYLSQDLHLKQVEKFQ